MHRPGDKRPLGDACGALKSPATEAEALYMARRTSGALEAINEAEQVVERGERLWCAELQRLRGVFLTAMDAAETQIEASF